jgi:hypothetical protein
MLVLIYVDDILITCSNHAAIRDLLPALHCDFKVKDLESFNFFFGNKGVALLSWSITVSTEVHLGHSQAYQDT